MRERILEYLKGRKEAQFSLLKHLVLQPSHSENIVGVNAVGSAVSDALSGCGMDRQRIEARGRGAHLLFRSPACDGIKPQILLLGHMDTAFPLASGFDWYKREDTKVYGPGVIDMKGGLVVAIFALKALHAVGLLERVPVAFLCSSDEESNSLTSSELITAEAARSRAALVFESGGLAGEVVTGRKGRAEYEIRIQGRAGHAAATEGTASAIVELAHKILAIEGLQGLGDDLVVNVGVVEGGMGSNTVADQARALVDFRFNSHDTCRSSRNELERIIAHSVVPGTVSSLLEISSRPPMLQSKGNCDLYASAEELAHYLGISLRQELRSGVSDANIVAECGIPVLDGLGPCGGGDHSDREYLLAETLAQRTRLAALLVAELAKAE